VHRYRGVYQSPARSETPDTYADTSRGNREIPSPEPRAAVAWDVSGKSKTYADDERTWKSDRPVVPEKSPNKGREPGAEGMGGRGLAKREPATAKRVRDTEAGKTRRVALERVRQAAGKDKKLRFTALLHHITTWTRCAWPTSD